MSGISVGPPGSLSMKDRGCLCGHRFVGRGAARVFRMVIHPACPFHGTLPKANRSPEYLPTERRIEFLAKEGRERVA